MDWYDILDVPESKSLPTHPSTIFRSNHPNSQIVCHRHFLMLFTTRYTRCCCRLFIPDDFPRAASSACTCSAVSFASLSTITATRGSARVPKSYHSTHAASATENISIIYYGPLSPSFRYDIPASLLNMLHILFYYIYKMLGFGCIWTIFILCARFFGHIACPFIIVSYD